MYANKHMNRKGGGRERGHKIGHLQETGHDSFEGGPTGIMSRLSHSFDPFVRFRRPAS